MKIDEKKLNYYLKNNQLTKSMLCNKLGISSRTIAKISKGENIGSLVINKICNLLNCNINDIIVTNNILDILRTEKKSKLSGGLYHETQVRLTYNSNHMEGSKLTEDQTRYIFETKTLGGDIKNIKLDDILETNNHFKCIDYIIENADVQLDEKFIKKLHLILKSGTTDESKYGAGVYKIFQNTVGGIETTKITNVKNEIKKLLINYNSKKIISIEDIVEFHYNFEIIHPFQDGNGRIGRLIAFKECLKNNIVPFYISDDYKLEYYNGLKNWNNERSFLIETCLFGQDIYKRLLDYFEINY